MKRILMKFYVVFALLNFIGLNSCNNHKIIEEIDSCQVSDLKDNLKYNDLISDMSHEVISALVEIPDANGALGRNKDGYFHVRFQLGMTYLSDYAVKFQSEEAVSEYLKNLNYSFSYQRPEGGFELIPPDYLLQEPNYAVPSEADLTSGTAFFAYGLGLSLHTLNQSQWYLNEPSLGSIKNDIEALNPNIESMLTYLKQNRDLLNTVDEKAPNRLLFNAIAFYSLGEHLNDQEARNIGIDFANRALSQRNQSQGYFIEAGGWDSSYNGVAIKLGFELFTIIDNSTTFALKNELEKAVSCATHWQSSRTLADGEISTEGNTRVFPGGEDFLGNEKGVDVVKTVKAFLYMNTLSDDNQYKILAQKIIDYYD